VYPVAVMNLGVSLIHIRQYELAREKLLEALEQLEADDLAYFATYTRLAMHLWTAAATNDRAEWDRHYIRFATETADYQMQEAMDHTLAACGWWTGHNDAERAAQALALARQFTPANL